MLEKPKSKTEALEEYIPSDLEKGLVPFDVLMRNIATAQRIISDQERLKMLNDELQKYERTLLQQEFALQDTPNSEFKAEYQKRTKGYKEEIKKYKQEIERENSTGNF